MSTKKGLLKGSKISRRHSTVIEAAEPLVEAAKALPQVSKVVLGEIVPLKGAPMRLKFVPVPAGLKMVVRGGATQQTFFLYTADPHATEHHLEAVWKGERN